MAKKAASAKRAGEGESIQGYFKRILRENPRLLKGRSNAELLQRWQEDHGSPDEIPHSVKAGLQNAKSALRSRGRKRRARKAAGAAAGAAMSPKQPAAARRPRQPLEALEEQIDDCLTAARALDREGLETVIHLLRRARNEVVWKMGQ
jgi:hypothetical protein